MPITTLNRARRLRVGMPANVAVVGSALASSALAFWVVIMALITAQLFVVAVIPLLVTGLAMVQLAVNTTSPTLQRLLQAPTRGE